MADPSLEFDSARICRDTAVRRVELHAELPSTSDLALSLGGQAAEADLPLLVLAARQTGGRGRGDHRWWAGHGALTFSLVVDTLALQLAPRRWPRVSLATGITVAETLIGQLPPAQPPGTPWPNGQPADPLRSAGSCVQAKWPNDIFVGGRKICGILTENVALQPHRLVIGIGLNVNNSWRDAPDELQTIGTSLVDVAQRTFFPEEILVDLLQRLDQTLAAIADDSFPLAESWRGLCMLEGHTVTVETAAQRTTGVCHGINDDGALLLQNEGGIQHCVAGTVVKIQ